MSDVRIKQNRNRFS